MLLLLTLTACSTPEQRAAESSRLAASSAADAAARDALFADIMSDVVSADDLEIPSGYKDQQNGVAYKWLEKSSSEYTCDYGKCSNLKVFSYRGCPSSVYGKVNFENSAGTVVGWTNDTLGSLPRGSYGILKFTYMGSSDATKVRLTELSCH